MEGESRGAFGGSGACGRLGEARTGGALALQFLLNTRPDRSRRGLTATGTCPELNITGICVNLPRRPPLPRCLFLKFGGIDSPIRYFGECYSESLATANYNSVS